MTFTLITKDGSKVEIDPARVEGFVVEHAGRKYDISIKEIQ